MGKQSDIHANQNPVENFRIFNKQFEDLARTALDLSKVGIEAMKRIEQLEKKVCMLSLDIKIAEGD